MIQIKPNMLDQNGDLYYFYGFIKSANEHSDYITRKDAATIGNWILAAQERTIKALSGCSFETIMHIVSDTTDAINCLVECASRGDKKLCATI